MTKVKNIQVTNYKPVDHQELDLNGCSAIITAANDSGKTSLLQGLIDRLRSKQADQPVKEGEQKGQYRMELTDGSTIEWNFTEKSERLKYITSEGLDVTSGVIGTIGNKYFGKGFDIDKFLSQSPKKQQETIEGICGLDLSKIDEKYEQAYFERTEANREVKRLGAMQKQEPEKVEKPDVDSIKQELKEARSQNEDHRNAKIEKRNRQQTITSIHSEIDDSPFEKLFDFKKAKKVVDSVNVPEKVDTEKLEQKLDEAQNKLRQYDSYERDKKEYDAWIKEGKKARKEAEQADKKVKEIEKEKKELIASAELPDGFSIGEDGLTYKGYALDRNQLSASAIHIAALKLASMAAGECKTFHFDAATLDNKNLGKVNDWANENGYQLLIERPDLDGGKIEYKIIGE